MFGLNQKFPQKTRPLCTSKITGKLGMILVGIEKSSGLFRRPQQFEKIPQLFRAY